MGQITPAAEDFLAELGKALDIPISRYEAAERSYKSVSAWLDRPESECAGMHIEVYTQGSFRLGTVIRPIDDEEHYDLDIVCEFSLSKSQYTQKELHDMLGRELKLYAKAHNMERPSPWQRCWTLNYADSAQFHMDLLPAVPDGARQRQLRKSLSVSIQYAETSVSIPDSEHPNYRRYSDDWPASNPNGYANWFYERMKPTFDRLMKAMQLTAKADVAEIPAFRVKTPLQSAIQILKRHRDTRFAEEPNRKPSSIILTTLAAHGYQQQSTIAGALMQILTAMDQFIEQRNGVYWIPNPSDPRENFADEWASDPDLKDAFYDWLETARTDFSAAAAHSNATDLLDTLSPRLGRGLIEATLAKQARMPSALVKASRAVGGVLQRVLDAPHRRPLAWPPAIIGSVSLSGTWLRNGFRPLPVTFDGAPVASGSSLTFNARTTVQQPYRVYWQVVNTGRVAAAAHQLRGKFEEGQLIAGNLTKHETARYRGVHSIECFIIKNGRCAARSGPLLVNIE